jgi:hypothetical protein
MFAGIVAGATEDMDSEFLSRSAVEGMAAEGKGMLLTNFKDIHSYYLSIARKENRQISPGRLLTVPPVRLSCLDAAKTCPAHLGAMSRKSLDG